MRTLMITALVFGLLVGAGPAKDAKTYGEPVPTGEAMALNQAVEKFASVKGKTILASGEIKKVCQKKGCWMEVRAGETQMRVTFKDYGFFVRKDLDGSKVRMHGKLVKKETSVAEQKHYLEDAKASAEEIAAVTKPKVEYSFVAAGVEVL